MQWTRHFWLLLALFALNFDVAKDLEKYLLKSGSGVPRSTKIKFIRDIAICKQSMATSRVKNMSSSADREYNFLVLSILGVLGLANYQKCL